MMMKKKKMMMITGLLLDVLMLAVVFMCSVCSVVLNMSRVNTNMD